MPTVYGADLVKCAITYTNADGNQAVNVLWFEEKVNGVTAGTMAVLEGVVVAWLGTNWASVANQAWAATRIDITNWDGPEGIYTTDTFNLPGTLTGNALPSEVTIAISLRTGFTGRSRRGRVYHVGIGEDNADGDFISSGYENNLITAYVDLLSAAQAQDWTWVVASMVSEGAPRLGVLQTPITQIVITDRVVDSMRRRKPTI